MSDKYTVVIADDQPHLLITLQYLLSSIDGVEVLSATNGQEAADLAIRHRPPLVLLDVSMPVMDGIEACRLIRSSWPPQHHGAIWFVTARSTTLTQEEARRIGAERLITKPFDPDRLVQAVWEQVALHAGTI